MLRSFEKNCDVAARRVTSLAAQIAALLATVSELEDKAAADGHASATVTAATSTDPNGVIVTVVENDAASDAITVQIPRTLAVGGKLFGRLQLIK